MSDEVLSLTSASATGSEIRPTWSLHLAETNKFTIGDSHLTRTNMKATCPKLDPQEASQAS